MVRDTAGAVTVVLGVLLLLSTLLAAADDDLDLVPTDIPADAIRGGTCLLDKACR